MTVSKALLAQLVTRIEALSIENLKLRVIVLSSQEAELEGFSWHDLVEETAIGGDTEWDLHSLSDEVREQIHESDDPSPALETFLTTLSTLTL
jgi:hypothetical protein